MYEMEYSPLGKTGLMVSRISYGGAGLGNIYTGTDEDDAVRCVRRAVDEYGINYFDTAPSYGLGALGEKRLGKALEDGYRDRVVLASKCGDYLAGDARESWVRNCSGEAVRIQLEHQLRRLRTDHLDVLQIHDIDSHPLDRLLEDTIPAMERLRREGKVRFLGITSIHLPSLRYILERTESMDVVLTFGRYNLMDTSLVGYFDDLRARKGFGLLNCSVLFMGLISEKTISGEYRTTEVMSRREGFEKTRKALEQAAAVCAEAGTNLASLGVQFGCDCPFCDSTLISMARTSRLDQNMELLKRPYDRALAGKVSSILKSASLIPDSFGIVRPEDKI